MKRRPIDAMARAIASARLGTDLGDTPATPTPAPTTIVGAAHTLVDKHPPPVDAKGMPTIRNAVDALFYCAPRARPACAHTWEPVVMHPLLRRCTRCRWVKVRKAAAKLDIALPLLRDRLYPPADARGRYYERVIINENIAIVRSQVATPGAWSFVQFQLYVRFPKGWLWTSAFSEHRFDALIRAVDPLLDADPYDPRAAYRAAQTALYGKAWTLDNPTLERLC